MKKQEKTLIKEFKKAKYPHLYLVEDILTGKFYFQFENKWTVNYLVIYPSVISHKIFPFATDYSLNKRQLNWLQNNVLKLCDILRSKQYLKREAI